MSTNQQDVHKRKRSEDDEEKDKKTKKSKKAIDEKKASPAAKKQQTASVSIDLENCSDAEMLNILNHNMNDPNQLKKILPYYMIPKKMIPLETFPINKNGKVDRKKLLSISETHLETEDINEPKTDIENEIYSIWRISNNKKKASI